MLLFVASGLHLEYWGHILCIFVYYGLNTHHLAANSCFRYFNVWVLRASKVTPYRGRDASNLKEEFFAYGLNNFTFYLVGALKIAAALALLLGIAYPAARLLGAAVLLILMAGAILMHLKVKDAAISLCQQPSCF